MRPRPQQKTEPCGESLLWPYVPLGAKRISKSKYVPNGGGATRRDPLSADALPTRRVEVVAAGEGKLKNECFDDGTNSQPNNLSAVVASSMTAHKCYHPQEAHSGDKYSWAQDPRIGSTVTFSDTVRVHPMTPFYPARARQRPVVSNSDTLSTAALTSTCRRRRRLSAYCACASRVRRTRGLSSVVLPCTKT